MSRIRNAMNKTSWGWIVALGMVPMLLAGCSNGYKEKTFPVKPGELADCRFFELTNDTGSMVTVARCPNSTTTTTYKSGKTMRSTVIIDGKQYVEKEATE